VPTGLHGKEKRGSSSRVKTRKRSQNNSLSKKENVSLEKHETNQGYVTKEKGKESHLDEGKRERWGGLSIA